MNTYAMVSKPGNIVTNVFPADYTRQELSDMFPDYIIVEITEGLKCRNGDYYNPADGLFYIDPDFTWLSGTTPPPSVDEAYGTALQFLRENGEYAATQIRVPYSHEEAQTWWCQAAEATAWTADNNSATPMLDQMVAESSGGWTKPTLAANIISNADEWKLASGKILGELKTKRMQLASLKAEVIAGSKTVYDIVNFNTEITIPPVNIQDKYE